MCLLFFSGVARILFFLSQSACKEEGGAGREGRSAKGGTGKLRREGIGEKRQEECAEKGR